MTDTGTPRRALVTGAAGFLGRHLVARLLRDGVGVHGVSRVARLLDRAVSLRFGDQPPGTHPSRPAADVARTRACLGWYPTVSLDDGLRRTIAWFRQTEAP